jgi:hypothetical protein
LIRNKYTSSLTDKLDRLLLRSSKLVIFAVSLKRRNKYPDKNGREKSQEASQV